MFPIICVECDSQFFSDNPSDAPICSDCIQMDVEYDEFGDFEDSEDDGQPSEYTEWMDYDPDC